MTNHDETIDDWGDHVLPSFRGQNKSAACRISVTNKGRVLTVYPSSDDCQVMDRWQHGARANFRADASGDIKSVQLSPADRKGLNIRRYDSQSVSVHVRVPRGYVAKCDGDGQQVCETKIDGDAVLIRIPPTISFEPAASR